MTCIVGVECKGKLYIGGDSCASNYYVYHIKQDEKVFARHSFLIGTCGGIRVNDRLRYSLSQERLYPGDDVQAFMREKFVEAVRKCLREGGCLKKTDEVEEFKGCFIVGYEEHLWIIQNDLSVLAAEPWGLAIGSGEEAARGSLFTTRNKKNPLRLV